MKFAHTEDVGQKGISGSTRTHIISRLNKASKAARALVEILADQSSTADKINVLEARAYASFIAGAEEFEKQSGVGVAAEVETLKQRWQRCLELYSESRIIYAALLHSTKRDVFREVLAGTIDPSIRYTAYQSRLPRSLTISAVAKQKFPKEDTTLRQEIERLHPEAFLDESLTEAKPGQAVEKVPDRISWRGRTANIADAAIGQALASVYSATEKLRSYLASVTSEKSTREKAAAYDEILTASQDAVDATKRASEELTREGVSPSDPRQQDLAIVSLSANYSLVSWRIGRNRVLIGRDDGMLLEGESQTRKPKRPRKDGKEWVEKEEGTGRKLARLRERVVLYDATLQSIDSIKEMPGAARDTTFVEELDAKKDYFRALRCLNIAYSHALLSAPQNALALLSRASEYSTSATRLSTSSEPHSSDSDAPLSLDISLATFQTLHEHIRRQVTRYHALCTLHHLPSAEKSKPSTQHRGPLVERLNEYPAGGAADLTNLVNYPPTVQTVPVKPIFLDVAWSYIQYPGRTIDGAATPPRAEEKKPEDAAEEKRAEQKKRGWFGFGR